MAQDISQEMRARFQAQDTPALIEMVKKSKAGKDDAEMAALQHVLAARRRGSLIRLKHRHLLSSQWTRGRWRRIATPPWAT